MKTATIPPLRVTPSLREGETLSAFLEESLKTNITRRRMQEEFLARGLKSRDDARRSGDDIDAEIRNRSSTS